MDDVKASGRDALRALVEKWRTEASEALEKWPRGAILPSKKLRDCADELAAALAEGRPEPQCLTDETVNLIVQRVATGARLAVPHRRMCESVWDILKAAEGRQETTHEDRSPDGDGPAALRSASETDGPIGPSPSASRRSNARSATEARSIAGSEPADPHTTGEVGLAEGRPVEDPEPWLDPTPEMLNDPQFEAIWQRIKSWDINVPHAYIGYMGATGNHVRAILDALREAEARSATPVQELTPENSGPNRI